MSSSTATPDDRRDRVDRELLRRYRQHHDLVARDRVIERCLPLVQSLAWGYRDRGEDLEDLVQAGSIGLVKAVHRFDPDAGARFVSFAAPTISGEIKRHFRDHCWVVHVPRSVQDLALKVQSETRRALERSGREPSAQDLAERLGTTAPRIEDAQAGSRAYRPSSLDTPPDRIADRFGREDPGYAQVENRLLISSASQRLDRRSRRIVEDRFYDDQVQREIAQRHSVSPMLVSKILTRALDDMHHQLQPLSETPALQQAA